MSSEIQEIRAVQEGVDAAFKVAEMETAPDPKRDALRFALAHDPEEFGKQLFSRLIRLPSALCHRAIDEARGDSVIEMPRGHAKTTRGLFLRVMRAVLIEHVPLTVIVADSQDKANAALETVRHELEFNPEVSGLYDEQRGETWGAEKMTTRSGCCVMARGWGQSPRGLIYLGNRPGLIVVDDPEDLESVLSREQRDKTEAQFLSDLMPAREPGAPVVVIGTRIDDDCLVARLARNPMFQHVRFVAIEQEAERQDLWEHWRAIRLGEPGEAGAASALAFYELNASAMDAGAKVLWPERWPYYALQCERLRIGSVAFDREYQMRPYDPTTATFRPDWFRRVKLADLAGAQITRVIGVDSALGRTRSADASAIVVIGRLPSGQLAVLEVDEAVRSPHALVERLFALDAKHKHPAHHVEADGFQDLLRQDVEKESKARGLYLSVRPIMTRGVPKSARIQRLSPMVETGTIVWSDGPGVERLIQQAIHWKPEQKGDDHGLDALEMAVRGLSEGAGGAMKNLGNLGQW
jgi:predicted phage terminase large subunit-like protein